MDNRKVTFENSGKDQRQNRSKNNRQRDKQIVIEKPFRERSNQNQRIGIPSEQQKGLFRVSDQGAFQENKDPNRGDRKERKKQKSSTSDNGKKGPQLKQFKCNVCFSRPGYYMNDCGCFYCKDCNLDSQTHSSKGLDQSVCVACGGKKYQSYDIRDRKQVRKLESDLTNPKDLLNKVIHAIQFQELHDHKFIGYLQAREANLQLENKDLKAQVQLYKAQCLKYQDKSRQRKQVDGQKRDHDNRSNKGSFIDPNSSSTPQFKEFTLQNRIGQQSDQLSDALSVMSGKGNQGVIRPNIDNRSLYSDSKYGEYAKPLQNVVVRGSKLGHQIQRKTNHLDQSISSKQISPRIMPKTNAQSFAYRPVVPQSTDVTTLRSNSLNDMATTSLAHNNARVTQKRPQFNNEQRNRKVDRSLPLPSNDGKGSIRYGQHAQNGVRLNADQQQKYSKIKNDIGKRRTYDQYDQNVTAQYRQEMPRKEKNRSKRIRN